MNVTSPHSPVRESAVDKKLSLVETALRSAGTKDEQEKHSASGPTALALPGLAELAQLLFENAPANFLGRESVADLASLVRRVARALAKSVATPRPPFPCIETAHALEQCTEIILVTEDVPFIVSTVTSVAERLSLRLHALLHPILSLGTHRLSVNVIQVYETAPSRIEAFVSELRLAMELLLPITRDFAAMQEQVRGLALALSSETKHQTSDQQPHRAVSESDDASPAETAAFLDWLCEERFVFMGIARSFVGSEKQCNPEPRAALGLFCASDSATRDLLAECRDDIRRLIQSPRTLLVSRLHVASPVHRPVRLLHIAVCLRHASADCELVSIVGQLTSRGFAEEASSVPLVRQKLAQIVRTEAFVPNSHNFKIARNIFDTMPKHEALVLSTETLRSEVRQILSLQGTKESRALIRIEESGRGYWIVVIFPSERVHLDVRRKIYRQIERTLSVSPAAVDSHIAAANSPLCRLYLYVAAPQPRPNDESLAELADVLEELTRGWDETLEERLEESRPHDSKALAGRFHGAFPPDYQSLFTPDEALEDVLAISALSPAEPLRVVVSQHLRAPLTQGSTSTIKIFSLGRELVLSETLPALQSCGFEILHERSFAIRPSGSEICHSHQFLVRFLLPVVCIVDDHLEVHALTQALRWRTSRDDLQSLMLQAALTPRAVAVIRTYCQALWQMRKFASPEGMYATLRQYPALARALWQVFESRFCPSAHLDASTAWPGGPETDEIRQDLARREQECSQRIEAFRDLLHHVSDVNQDRILRALLSLIEHTVRTNVFRDQDFIALKFRSEKIDLLLPPRPLFEIFVSAPDVEGVHLRSAKVARGGIRWSERREDYRTEVRDLMKTQRVKNAIITPSGAKGGFIVREMPSDPKRVRNAVESSYRTFIRALLSVTDNIVDGVVVHPPGVVCFDGEDPYLVVAADKGTATFSDVANAIACDEYGFWLGDAFASGGSRGYDHKKLGITARGAWEAGKIHLSELGIDYEAQHFSVIGIGDMSGDVFGNGLLLSPHMQLIAAFNHRHIFIDPAPDPQKAWEERKRLFDLPGSQWSDYSTHLISTGGGVFDRFARAISISPEMRRALGIPADVGADIGGEQLISFILRAPVDLLWNGGIGTYVRASDESDAEVNDSANDRVRVPANQLRARAVVEGGNLGLTQRARVEYSHCGGLVNTDAIDNSGGVDTSDHEVNLKLLLSPLVRRGRISIEERDTLLAAITPKVVHSVLSHNRSQALLLTASARRAHRNMEYFRTLVAELVRRGYLDRKVDGLPDDEQLRERARTGRALVRPELALCLAAVKMWVKDELLNSGLARSAVLRRHLEEYFPDEIVTRFTDALGQHPLADHIVATQVTNSLIEAVGLTFIHRISLDKGVPADAVIAALLTVYELLEVQNLQRHISRFSHYAEHRRFLELRRDISAGLRDATAWFISHHQEEKDITALFERYRAPLGELVSQAASILTGSMKEYYVQHLRRYEDSGLAIESARPLALFSMLPLCLEVLYTSARSASSLAATAPVFCWTLDELGIYRVLTLERAVETKNKWEYQLKLTTYEQIRRNVSRIAAAALARAHDSQEEVIRFLRSNPRTEQLKQTLRELSEANPQLAILAALPHQLRSVELAAP